MKKYSAKALSKLAGVSVRTLHHYDKIGLLKPAIRTEARYRLYGENELLKLQQILFYKELDLPLKAIIDILEAPDFDIIEALEHHQKALISKQKKISVMLNTIEKTMLNLKEKKMITEEELYEGFPKEKRQQMRQEAIDKFGKDKVETSENYLKGLSKQQFEQLKEEQKNIFEQLFSVSKQDPESETVQLHIARHYENTMKFWGLGQSSDPLKQRYKGLGDLYLTDGRFTMVNGEAQPAFAEFLSKAMKHYADTQL